MKILTLNTWQDRGPWADRWNVTLEGLERLRPDICGFQELFSGAWAEEIKKRSGFRRMLYTDEKCGNVIYTHDPVKDSGMLTLSQSPLEDYGRYVIWAHMEICGHELYVFNTHLSWMLEDGQTREKQINEILDLIQKKNPQGESLLMGDLNSHPESAEIKYLIEEGHFRDLFDEAHPGDKRITWDNQNPYVAAAHHQLPDRRIDYILARGKGPLLKHLASCDLVLTKPTEAGIWASDHYGVIAEFKTEGGI